MAEHWKVYTMKPVMQHTILILASKKLTVIHMNFFTIDLISLNYFHTKPAIESALVKNAL